MRTILGYAGAILIGAALSYIVGKGLTYGQVTILFVAGGGLILHAWRPWSIS